MSIWRPDPTFYPSPKMAMEAPAEKLAYVAMVNGDANGRHDAIGVVDVDPASSGYGHIVGQVDMPNAGDGTLYMPAPNCGTKRMIPCSLQLPPVAKGASQIVSTPPPEV